MLRLLLLWTSILCELTGSELVIEDIKTGLSALKQAGINYNHLNFVTFGPKDEKLVFLWAKSRANNPFSTITFSSQNFESYLNDNCLGKKTKSEEAKWEQMLTVILKPEVDFATSSLDVERFRETLSKTVFDRDMVLFINFAGCLPENLYSLIHYILFFAE